MRVLDEVNWILITFISMELVRDFFAFKVKIDPSQVTQR